MPAKKGSVDKKRLGNHGTGVRIHNARKKEKDQGLSPKQIFLISVMFLFFMMSGIGYVWSNFEGTQIGYDLSRLQEKEMELKELNRKLKLELAYLKSPQYLEEAAEQAGLRQPQPEQVVLIK
ncbi:MAG: cell division protein FtsL [Desulfobacteraceae bacterium]